MAIINRADFDAIILAHGEDAFVIRVESTISETQADTSPFDMIYGFADPAGEAGSGSTELKKAFKCLIQEVKTGQEAWISAVGTLAIGDAVMFSKAVNEDPAGDFMIAAGDIIESPTRDNQRYLTETPQTNLDGNKNIFFQTILRKQP